MRDVMTICAAGALMAAYALVAPSIVKAVQRPLPGSQKMFVQRLAQAGGDGPVSAVTVQGVAGMPTSSALPLFARY
ncbi:hypothetical protein [Methylobacterium gnaphalii]|nr:hypothetical protein [Methylobacterium gnaphalii]GJD70807.1 hypothetical protein MMMDOFMJ_3760 [Methylobacterium gnaphalii]